MYTAYFITRLAGDRTAGDQKFKRNGDALLSICENVFRLRKKQPFAIIIGP